MGRIAGCVAIVVLLALGPRAFAQDRVVLINEEHPVASIPFDAGVATSLVVSADGRRGAYIKRDEDHFRVVIDGKDGEVYDQIAPGSLVFSPDGSRFVYAARLGKRWHVIESGEPSEPYDDIVGTSLSFSPDGKHFAEIVTLGKKRFVVLDGRESVACDEVIDNRLVFSPDGRLCYAARRNGRALVVLDGAESLMFEDVTRPMFSSDGTRLAYVAFQAGQPFIMFNNTEQRAPKPGIRASSLTLSGDGKRVAYVTESRDGMRVVADDTEGEAYKWIFDESITFSPDGARLAYAVRRGESSMVILDGKPLPPCDGVVPGSITFSRDGRRIAYIAEYAVPHDVFRCVVLDGVAGAFFERIRGVPRFSDDGKDVAYIGERTEQGEIRHFVVVNDTPGKPYLCIRGEPRFSPDGSRVAVLALGADDRFDAGEELPRVAGEAGATRLVLNRTIAFRRITDLDAANPQQILSQPRKAREARRQRPIHILLVQEQIERE